MLTDIQVAEKLLQINAIRLDPQNPFRWASGLRSPIYCDNRRILSFPKVRDEIKQSLIALAKKFDAFDKVAGVATAGIPHGAILADALHLPFAYVRSSAKKHGTRNQIEGIVESGDRCLVVEDLISTGGSSIHAVEVLRDAGAEVVGVVAIFTYGFESAKQNFGEAKCPYKTLSNYFSLIQAVEEADYLSTELIDSLRRWRKDPVAWSNQYSI